MKKQEIIPNDDLKDLEIYDLEAVKKLKEAKREKEKRSTHHPQEKMKKPPFLTRLKQQYTTKKFKNGAYSSLVIIFILVAVVLINLIVGEFDLSFDLSSQGMYTLSGQSKEVAEEIQDDITLYYVCEGGSEITMLKNIISKYEKLSDHIKVVYKDPAIYPSFTSQYVGVGETVDNNSIVVVNETTGTYKYIPYGDMLEYDYTNYYYGYSDSPELTAIDVEGQVTGAIAYVITEDKTKLYAVSGHGETSLSSYLENEFAKLSTEVSELATRTATSIPEDCDILLINGPVTDFTEDEVAMIKTYLQAGGKAIMTLNYAASDLTNYKSLLDYYGITVTEGVVFESASNSPSNYPYYTFPDLDSHQLTEGISKRVNPVILPFAQAITAGETRSTVTVTPFMETSEDAYCKTEDTITTYEKESGDKEGPFYAGAVVTETYNEVESTLIVIASNYLFDDNFAQYDSYGNVTLINNMISYLGGQETGLSIPSKSMEESYIVTTDSQVVTWTIVLVILLPLMFIGIGITVWYRRRNR